MMALQNTPYWGIPATHRGFKTLGKKANDLKITFEIDK